MTHPEDNPMSIDPREATASLNDIADVERRTREAIFYFGSSTIFIMWGLLVACGYGIAEWLPRSARATWPLVTVIGCVLTALIIALRSHAPRGQRRDRRIIWAAIALIAFGSIWTYVLGPIVPRPMIYAFQPSLVMLGMVLAGLWLGRFFLILGLVGAALIGAGDVLPEPWLRLWMAIVQSGTLIIGGLCLRRVGFAR
jgi:hypothetical protein